ncbi:tyrosinase cofactor [Streptomyces sp. NPDC086787]|uniref:apotyrosinase chaperone MelC1 n=1 Tax=Streptomyces sp. NPDC086787 TaxID=3365759 RepID=UPI0038103C6E
MPELTRRRALTAAAAFTAAAAVPPLAAHSASADTAPATPSAPSSAAHQHGSSPAPFDEVYKGRRIQGRQTTGGGHHHEHGGGYSVFVDGVELHMMQNADSTWISVVTHYEPVATPRAAARAAVDELQGAPLVPLPVN